MPVLRVGVSTGTGTGSPEKPGGYPWYSLAHTARFRGWLFLANTGTTKGAPGLESRTGPQLVSPAEGYKKNKWKPLYFGLKISITQQVAHLGVH